jgi:hypothetical protein
MVGELLAVSITVKRLYEKLAWWTLLRSARVIFPYFRSFPAKEDRDEIAGVAFSKEADFFDGLKDTPVRTCKTDRREKK